MTEEFTLDPEIYGISPEEARHRLEFMGFVEDTWTRIMGEGLDGSKFGSHEIRSLITVARGSTKRLLGEVYQEMRKQDGLPPERR